jgi:hypothetical protein
MVTPAIRKPKYHSQFYTPGQRPLPRSERRTMSPGSGTSRFVTEYAGCVYYPVAGRPDQALEVDSIRDGFSLAEDEVITGVGIRLNPGNANYAWAKFSKIDPNTGLLSPAEVWHSGSEAPEARVDIQDSDLSGDFASDLLLTGVGFRATGGGGQHGTHRDRNADVTTVWLWTKRIQPDGSLTGGTPEATYKIGAVVDHVEAIVDPPRDTNSVLVGLGFSTKPGTITHMVGYYGKLVRR